MWWGVMSSVLLMMLLLSFASHALPEKRAPMNVKAHTVVIDERLGLSTYTGNASITQGSLAVSAEKIQIFSKKQVITKVIATGTKKKLAHYQQNQPNRANFVEAVAQKIVYFIDKQQVRLEGEAHLTQGFESFSGGVLDYDIKEEKIIANKSKDGTRRVRFKIKL